MGGKKTDTFPQRLYNVQSVLACTSDKDSLHNVYFPTLYKYQFNKIQLLINTATHAWQLGNLNRQRTTL